MIRKHITLKLILFIMFANLKIVLRSYTSLYGIFTSASLTLFILNFVIGKYYCKHRMSTKRCRTIIRVGCMSLLYVMRLETAISTSTTIRSIQRAKRDSDWYMIRKHITLKSILFIMFANLKIVLRKILSVYIDLRHMNIQ